MKKIFLIKTFVIYFASIITVHSASSNYFNEGLKLYNQNKFDESKIFFEKDLVFNPKSEKSYLYLAKIFEENNDQEYEEINLRNVLLLNPKNNEAIYMLILLKINQSNYNSAKELIEQFKLVCNSLCSKKDEIDKKFKKLDPKNAKINN